MKMVRESVDNQDKNRLGSTIFYGSAAPARTSRNSVYVPDAGIRS